MKAAKILFTALALCCSALAQSTYLYVADYHGNAVSAFSVDLVTGALTPIGTVPAGGNPGGGTSVDRNCRFVYVANTTSSNVSGYSITANTGALTALSGAPFSAGTSPLSTAVDQSTRFLYVPNNGDSTISGFSVNSASGALTALAGSPFMAAASPQHDVIDPSNRFLYVSNDSGSVSGFVIDSSTGALSPITGSPWATGSLSRYVRADIAGKFLYVSNTGAGSISIFSIDQTTGALTEVSGSPVPVVFNIYELQIEPQNKYAYVGSIGNGIFGFSINSTTGMLTPLPGFPVAPADRGRMGIDATGKFLYSSNQNTNNLDAFQIDSNTGNLTQFASFPAGSFPDSIAMCSPPNYHASIQQPVDSDGSSVFSASRGVVPVKFTLTLNGQPTCSLPPATISLQRTQGANVGSIDESVYTGASDMGSQFRIVSCQYVYNLTSRALGPGSYSVEILINGAVVGSAGFALK